MNPVSRLASLFLGLLLAVLMAACAPKVELMAAIPESDANEVLGALQNAGITAEKVPGKEGMVGLQIAADQLGRAMELLREKGLPRERFAGMGQVFKKEGLISSPLEERARYLYALTQELSGTLNQIDGVIVARVHVVLPERSTGAEAAVPSSAAVFLKYQEGYDMELVQPLVRRLVINSIPGLTADKLTIVMVPSQSQRPRVGGVGAANPGAASPGAMGPGAASPWAAAAGASASSAGEAGSAEAGLPWGLLLVGFLALVAAGGLFAWRRGLVTRWLPEQVRARLGMG